MNQADFWVTLTALAISQLLTPFLQFRIIQVAVSHLSKGIGESSMTVPTLIENSRLAWCLAQVQVRRFWLNFTVSQPQVGQITLPSGHRRIAK
jgi:hypothetical protein